MIKQLHNNDKKSLQPTPHNTHTNRHTHTHTHTHIYIYIYMKYSDARQCLYADAKTIITAVSRTKVAIKMPVLFLYLLISFKWDWSGLWGVWSHLYIALMPQSTPTYRGITIAVLNTNNLHSHEVSSISIKF